MDFHPARGREQEGRRPALVVQNDTGNQAADYTIVVALTTAEVRKPYPFLVALAAGEGGLKRAGAANCTQILTIDQNRLDGKIGELDDERMRQVDEALKYQLGLE